MSSYPILNNKPIDQWKVTELKEELRRRRLPVSGLKDALVRKLDEALRKEMEMVNDEEMNDSKTDSESEDSDDKVEDGDIQVEGTPDIVADPSEKIQNDSSAFDNDGGSSALNQGGQGEEHVTEVDPTFMEAEAPVVTDEITTSPILIEVTALDAMEETLPAVRKEISLALMEESDSAKQSMATNNENAQASKPDEKLEDLSDIQVEGTPDIVADPSEKTQNDSSAFDNDGGSSALNQGGQCEEHVTEVDPTFMEAEAPVVTDEITTSLILIEETALDAMEETLPAVTKEISLASMEESDSAKQSMASNSENAQASKPDEKHEDLKSHVEDIEFNLSEPSVEGDGAAKQNVTCYNSSGQDSGNEKKHDNSKPDTADVKHNLLVPENQVSVVSLDLGSQVKSESLPTDSMSIIEKNKLKGNLNANDFHIEQEVIKQEMVQPSSNSLPVPPVGGDQHNINDDKELVENLLSMEGASCETAKNHDINKKEDSLDVGSPEKLNLDRSSGDESMDEDAVQSKHYEPSVKSGELGEPVETGKPHTKEGAMDSVTSLSNLGKENSVEEEIKPTDDATVKRKHEATELAEKNENVKRQRRWNSETIKVPERQVPNPSVSTLPKNEFQPTPRRTFTSFDHKPADESPKERIVPPSQNPSTTSLRIDRFLRPFTLKAVQELLGKTGTVCDFWMDHIKTHCYVTYSSVEEAIATRNAVYNLRWPVNGGNLLVAEFVDPTEVKEHIKPPQQAPLLITPSPRAPVTPSPRAPVTPSPTAPKVLQQHQSEQPPARQNSFRQQLPPPPPLHEKERLPPPPAPTKKPEPPPLTLDDLFVKTSATPRIYYLPLTDYQVAAKLSSGQKH